MAILTLADARALLFATLNVDGVNSLKAVSKVFDHEPRVAETAVPAIVTIFATGVSPADFLFAIRVYYETTNTPPSNVQHDMDAIIHAVDVAVAAEKRVGPSDWTIGEADNIAALVAQSDVTIGREDF